MSAPTLSGPTALTTLVPVLFRAQVQRSRLLGLAALGAVAVVLGLVNGSSVTPRTDTTEMLAGFGLGLVVPVGALLVASSTLGDLLEDRTLVYLLARPVSRPAVAVSAALAALGLLVPLVGGPLVLSAAVSGVGWPLISGMALATLVGLVAYVGVFLWVGLRLKRALVWGLAYILIWEGFVANAGAGLARLALRSWTRSVLSWRTDVALPLADRSPGLALAVPLVVGAVFVWLTARRLGRTDIP